MESLIDTFITRPHQPKQQQPKLEQLERRLYNISRLNYYYYDKVDRILVKKYFNNILPIDILKNIDGFIYGVYNNTIDDYFRQQEINQFIYTKRKETHLEELKKLRTNHRSRNSIIQFGKYKGKTFHFIFCSKEDYSDWLINKQIIKDKNVLDLLLFKKRLSKNMA